ncbi:MAG: hypothetical protein Q3X56_05140, partial [Sutterella sp.]|nr:hypothetical protein [Sutterella sp.]
AATRPPIFREVFIVVILKKFRKLKRDGRFVTNRTAGYKQITQMSCPLTRTGYTEHVKRAKVSAVLRGQMAKYLGSFCQISATISTAGHPVLHLKPIYRGGEKKRLVAAVTARGLK